MNRRFRLAPVERLRASAVQDALRALGQARADLAARQARHASLVHELAGCDAPATTTPDGARLAGDRRALLREQLMLAAGDVERCEAGVTQALGGWQSARAELRAIETLHERHRLAVAADDARREQRTLDDLAATGRHATVSAAASAATSAATSGAASGSGPAWSSGRRPGMPSTRGVGGTA